MRVVAYAGLWVVAISIGLTIGHFHGVGVANRDKEAEVEKVRKDGEWQGVQREILYRDGKPIPYKITIRVPISEKTETPDTGSVFRLVLRFTEATMRMRNAAVGLSQRRKSLTVSADKETERYPRGRWALDLILGKE